MSIVFVEEIDQHGLNTADDLFSVLKVGQLQSWMLLSQLWQVLLLPLLLCEEDILFLAIRDQDVLQYQSNDL